jgi:integrase/recombinase XerD
MKQLMSLLSHDMEQFLDLKESLGYSRGTYEYQLRKIDEYALSHYPELTIMNEKLVLGWSLKRENESKNYRRIRLHVIREFGKYQRGIGKNAYVLPTDFIDRQQPFIPYLFTDDELNRLFQAIDSIPMSKHAPNREYVLPVLFRMMFCCALRPGEPLKLCTDDVNFEQGTIFIKHSKRHKDRTVWMSEDLRQLCMTYNSYMGTRPFFFTSPNGKPYKMSWMNHQFRQICKKNILCMGVQEPRPYDLRHLACSKVILQWLEEGKDFYELAVFLREHMGHSDFESTFYYIHLLPENIVRNAGIDWNRFDSLYPEVSDEKA